MIAKKLLEQYREGELSTSGLRQKLKELSPQLLEKKPLSEGQKGLWMLEKVAPGTSAYNLPICFRIRKRLDTNLFRQALQYMVGQHPILQTIIEEENGIPLQILQQSQEIAFTTENISHLVSDEIIPFIRTKSSECFSLNEGPLMRVHVFERSETEHWVLINVHHIIFDGSSVAILVKSLLDAYLVLAKGERLTDVSPSSHYYDFINWEQKMLASRKGEEHRAYWKQQLSGTLPILDLPTDLPRHSAATFKGKTHSVAIPSGLKDKIKSFSKLHRISLPAFFLAAFNVLLHQYSNQRELIVGMASLGRPEDRFESLIGYFINMIPIRSRIDEEESFTEFTEQLQLTMLDGMDHSDYPFSAMVRELNLPRSISNAPVFQVGYFYQNFISSNQMKQFGDYHKDLDFELVEEIHQEGEYELALEVFEHDDRFQLNMKYNPDLYHDSTIKRMIGHFVRLTEEVIDKGDCPLGQYSLLSTEEEQTILLDWNATVMTYSKNKCVYELFEEQVRKTPEATAVIYENESITYRELDERSTKLAIYLQRQGVMPDSLVGISFERSLYMIVGLLGILKSGGAYVPLDPEYPSERLSYMIEDSRISIVISQSTLMNKLSELLSNEVTAIPLDTHWKTIEQTVSGQEVFQKQSGPDHLAYVMYTSGSTGNPKGVMIPHVALTNFLQSMGRQPAITSEDKLLAVTTYCFDIAGLELYLPLIYGATCYICSSAKQKNIELLKREIQTVRPTIMQATPATWTALFLYGWRNEERIKILCGGEALPERLKQFFIETDSEVWNMFGPTETTIWSTLKQIKPHEQITIGKPISNTQIYILNDRMMPVPVSIPGELYIGGDGLARGYLNLPKLTAERFIDNPFQPGTKLYRTGDSARWLTGGEIEYLGRIDNQVKLHGFRIELDEIETRLNLYPGIRESAVVIHKQQEHVQLRAYYVRSSQERHCDLVLKELRSYMKKWLPTHMIPSVFTEIESIPLTPNGKVNRLELSKRSGVQPDHEAKTAMSGSETERMIMAIWKDVIGIDELNIDDGFFDAGGDSFTAVTAVERISRKLDCEIKVTNLFEHANVRDLSKYILELKNEGQLHVGLQSPSEVIQTPWYQADKNRRDDNCNQQNEYPAYVEDSVAIIGISCQFSDANNYRQFWENLREGKESVRLLSDEELYELNIDKQLIDNPAYVPIQLTIEGKEFFDPEFFKISPKDAEMMDPQMRLLLLHSWKAVEDAGYRVKDIPNTAVYMSSSNNFYQAPDDPQQVHVVDDADTYVSWILGQAGTIPTMISYQLGLKGPSFSVHSNCSSSLVGMYSAFQSLRSGENDYALVGASTIHSSTSAGYVHMPGLNFSGDGHLKAFDTSADGMIGGEGAAVIVLKSAKKAIEDGDNIYAMLRDIKLNNDGSDKVGFYAPSIKGQADVIRNVLESTKIDPETISYIEAHGTGTKLGDPIEIAALSQIYNQYTTKRQYCGIGSVKTNIGHLDTAAGLAGCIKVALSLYHNQIPASLNFKEANREIDLRHSPFYVVDRLQNLEERPHPYRAALSSFGIGGTNAHAIFEKYTEMNPVDSLAESDYGRSYLIPLSARNDDRLKAYAHDLLHYMRSDNRHPYFSNIAFTLQVGRETMNSRVIFLVNDADDLIGKLEAYVEGNRNIDNCFEKKAKQSEASIQWFERDEDSSELIGKWIKKDKKKKLAMLWVNGLKLDWTLFYKDSPRPRRVSLPTYPFAQERYWKSESSHKPVAEKAKEAVPKLHPFIDRNTSDFMAQKYTTTLTGSEFFLVDHVIHNKKVLPGVAYIEMGRAAGELAGKRKIYKIKQIVWARPIIVEKSRDMEVVLTPLDHEIEFKVCTFDQEQQVIHAQGKLEVRMDTETELIIEESDEIFDIESCLGRCLDRIEHTDFYGSNASADVYQYGPTFRPIKVIYYNESEAISRIELPIEREEDFDAFTLHPSLLEGCLQTIVGLLQGRDTSPFMPFSIDEIEVIRPFPKQCYVYATRADHDSDKTGASKFNMKLYDPKGRIVALIRNYSIRTIPAVLGSGTTTSEKLETLYYHPSWEKATLEKHHGKLSGPLLIFTDSEQARDAFNFNSGDTIILVKPGEAFKDCLNNNYVINPERQDDYRKLLIDLKQKNRLPSQIVHLWSYLSSSYKLEAIMNEGIYSLFYLTKSLTEVSTHEKVKLLLIYNEESTIASALSEAISGFAKTVRLECPKFVYKMIRLQSEAILPEHIAAAEFEAEDGDEIRYTEEGRFVKRLKEGYVEQMATDKPMPFRNNGVYLITGGLGGIGLVLAKHLASTTQARLVLIGRSSLDDERQTLLAELESLGSEVLYIQADMSVREEVENALVQIRGRFLALHGIIHCAGVLDDKLIINKSYDEMKAVLAPKVNGTIWLDEASKEEALDFFILFSSVSHMGNVGQSDYAYANSFLNSFAEYRENLQIQNKRSGKTISINWPYWEEGGVRNAVK